MLVENVAYILAKSSTAFVENVACIAIWAKRTVINGLAKAAYYDPWNNLLLYI
jgi:hypothetical protein